MAARIATISGVFLAPGVSRNNRWYRPEVVKEAVDTLKRQLAEGGVPIRMTTSHGAGAKDDALHTAAAVREVWLDEDGRGRFRADVPDTTTGRDVANLLIHKYAGGVSIVGEWDNSRRVRGPNGVIVETGDNLRVGGIDLTGKPGIIGASVDVAQVSESVATEPVPIVETIVGDLSIRDGVPVDESDLSITVPSDGAITPVSESSTQPAAQAAPQETAVTETAKPAAAAVEESAATPQKAELSEASITALASAVSEAVAAAMKPAAPVTEAAPTTATPLTESAVQESIKSAVAEAVSGITDTVKAEVRTYLQENGQVSRKGRIVRLSESAGDPPKPLHEMDAQELNEYMAQQEAIPAFGA